jgi:hypothetical protein
MKIKIGVMARFAKLRRRYDLEEEANTVPHIFVADAMKP